MKEFFKHLYTDALGRPEIKNILGTIFVVASLVFLFVFQDAEKAVTLASFGAGMFTLSTIGDAVIDNKGKDGGQ